MVIEGVQEAKEINGCAVQGEYRGPVGCPLLKLVLHVEKQQPIGA